MLSEEQSAAPASSCSDPALLLLCPSHVAGTRGFYLLGRGMWLLLSPLQAQVLGLSMYLSLRRTDRARTLTCSHTRWHSQGLCTHLTGLPLACWPSLKFAADAAITGLSCLMHTAFTSPPVPLTWTPRPPHAPAQAVLRTPLAPVSGTCPSEIHTLAWHQYLAPTSFTPVPTSSWCPGLKVCRTPSDPNSYCPSGY